MRASEFQENLHELSPALMFTSCSNLQSHASVLPVAEKVQPIANPRIAQLWSHLAVR